jgi:hypothetical protein
VQGDNSSLHGDFEDVGHVPKVVHFEPLKVATKWCTLTGRRQFWRSGRGVIEVRSGSGGLLPGEDRVRTRGEAGSRTGSGSAESPQRLGSGARPGSLEGRLSGTGGNHCEWLERRGDELVSFLHPDLI